MDPKRWQYVQNILQGLENLPPSEQIACLNEACAGDETLRREIASFLGLDMARFKFLDHSIVERDGEAAFGENRIGPYQILHELGKGGMGAVYLAIRADEAYHKQVAVKILKRDVDTKHIVKRFLFERQILANLNHPYIAKLLDGGTSENGLPYLVMEYVEGEPIHHFCNARNWSIKERLRLFQKVCSAVQYAHRNLVIHRDLKPGNILVTRDGTPKLLDFGIAKLMDQGNFSPPTLTVTGFHVMTPEYASPEQVKGEAITTATDVYSLGVLLFELLTGRLPYQFNNRTEAEIQRVLCEQKPPKPSAAIFREEQECADTPNTGRDAKHHGTALRKRRHILAGDLDTIVLMALRKEPERRYASVEQLAQDIGFFLSGYPIRARKDTFLYRSSKFIQRHRFGLAVALVGFLLVLAFSTMLLFQRQSTIKERDHAREEKARMEMVSEFLVDLFETNNPYRPTRQMINAEELLEKASMEIGWDLEKDPETRAAVMANLGRIYTKLGRPQKARPLLEKALTIREENLAEGHPDAVRSLNYLGELCQLEGRYAEALAYFKEALPMAEKTLKPNHNLVPVILTNWAETLMIQANFSEAEAYFKRALQIQEGILPEKHPEIAITLDRLGEFYGRWNKYDLALSYLRKALLMKEDLFGPDHALVADTLANLGKANMHIGEFNAAEEQLARAYQIQKKVLGNQHPVFGVTLEFMAELSGRKGDYARAIRQTRQVLEIKKSKLGAENPQIANALENLAILYGETGQIEEAELLHKQVLELISQNFDTNHALYLSTCYNLASLYLDQEKYPEAEKYIIHALKGYQKLYGPTSIPAAETLNLLAALYVKQGRHEDAEPLFLQALEITGKHVGQRNLLATIQKNLARLNLNLGRLQEAEVYCQQVLAIREKLEGPDSELIGCLELYAEILRKMGRNKKAARFETRAAKTGVPRP